MLAKKIEDVVLEELMAAGLNSFELEVFGSLYFKESGYAHIDFNWVEVEDNREIENTLRVIDLECSVFDIVQRELRKEDAHSTLSMSSNGGYVGASCSAHKLFLVIS